MEIIALLIPVLTFVVTYFAMFLIMFGVIYIITVMVMVAEAIPVSMMAKKLGRKKTWLAWLSLIPLAGPYLLQYAIMDLAGDKPFTVADKIRFPKRVTSWWIWVAASAGGTTLAFVLFLVLSLIPFVGIFLGLLVFLILMIAVTVVAVVVNYVHLRDIMQLYREDEQNCQLISAMICVADIMFTGGLAEIVLLWLMAFREPLTVPAVEESDEEFPEPEKNS